MVQLALAGDFVPFAVNVDANEAAEALKPFLPLGETLGRLFTNLAEGVPAQLEIYYEGHLAEHDTRILTLAVLKGVFSKVRDEPVTYVNAPRFVIEHGIEVKEVSSTTSVDFLNLISVRGDGHMIAGALSGRRGEQRIVFIDDHTCNVPPAEQMLVVRNDDRPGMIGLVGTLLGDAGVNIADMDVGRHLPDGSSVQPGSAVMVLATGGPVPTELLARLRAQPGIVSVHPLSNG
jgi:D-3-phosphoglycerate dehydrogenase